MENISKEIYYLPNLTNTFPTMDESIWLKFHKWNYLWYVSQQNKCMGRFFSQKNKETQLNKIESLGIYKKYWRGDICETSYKYINISFLLTICSVF